MLRLPKPLLTAAHWELSREITPKKGKKYRLAGRDQPKKNKSHLTHLSALGPALRRMGMLATLANYRDEGNSEEATYPVYDLLYRILINEDAGLLRPAERKKLKDNKELLPYVLALPSAQRRLLRSRLEMVVLASKMMLRTFSLPDNAKNPDDGSEEE